jgi:hypothetical protein
LSEGNYHAVQNELEDLDPVYFQSKDLLTDAVQNGEVVAGLVSGTPSSNVNVFPSEQISVRAMLVRKDSDNLLRALDAAIVRVIESGGVEASARANPPYEALVVHSCKPSKEHFKWPNLTMRVIKIAALGPYFWGKADGDYTKTPYVGFWPDLYRKIEQQFINQYNVTFERVWYKTSAEVLQSINDGTTHATEPYMMIGAAHEDISRKSAFDLTCITSATQDKYFTRKTTSPTPPKTTNPTLTWIAGTAGGMLLVAIGGVLYMYRRERQGNPVFSKILLDEVTPVV